MWPLTTKVGQLFNLPVEAITWRKISTPSRQIGDCEEATQLEGRKNQNAATKMILQASSPDEVALVKYSNSIAMELIERDRTYVQLRNTKGIYENYDIIANFPFSS
jgi:magnesium-transporting ATPase (P-type)